MRNVAKNILGVATSLLGLSDQLKAGDPVRRLGMASLFEDISDSLAALSGEIRNGDTVVYARCAQLIVYAQALPRAIGNEVGDSNATTLGNRLHSGYDFERLTTEISEDTDKKPALAELEEASGKFRSLVHCLDVLSYRSRMSITVHLSELDAGVLSHLAERLGSKPQDLARAGISEFLQSHEDFEKAMQYVLKKNEELYRRLVR